MKANPKVSNAKTLQAGGVASTVDFDQYLEDYINEQRKQHLGCGNREVMNKLLELKPDALGGLPATATSEEAEQLRARFNNWYQRFRRRRGFSIRRRTSVGQKLSTGHEGMAWATLMKLRKALVERAGEIYAERNSCAPGESPIDGENLSPEQLESVIPEVFQELSNMDQTPIQYEMPVETTLERRGAKDTRISTGSKEKKRFTLCLAVMTDGSKVPLRIIFKGTPFIPPATPGKGTRVQPRKGSIAAEIAPGNRTKNGHPAGGTSFGVQEKSWCDARECTLWTSESWKLRPSNGSIIKQRRSILVLDDFKCHRDEAFIADLLKRCSTIVILIPGGLTPLLQPLDGMLNKQMKRLMRGKYTTYTATAVEDPKTGKLKPPGRGKVSTWCKGSWAAITPEVVQTCFKVCGLTLALDGSEDDAWCVHNFGEGYRELLQQQRVTWEAAHPGVTLPPLQLPKVPKGDAIGNNPITTAEKELEGKGATSQRWRGKRQRCRGVERWQRC